MTLILSTGFWTKKVPSFIRHSQWVQPGTVPLVSSQPLPGLTKIFLWLLGSPWWPAQGEHPSFHYDWNSGVGLFSLLHSSSCGQLIVRSNKLKHWTLEQRKFYCKSQARTMDGSCSKRPELSSGFQWRVFKGKFCGEGYRVWDLPLIDWWGGNWVSLGSWHQPSRIYMLMLSLKLQPPPGWVPLFL